MVGKMNRKWEGERWSYYGERRRHGGRLVSAMYVILASSVSADLYLGKAESITVDMSKRTEERR